MAMIRVYYPGNHRLPENEQELNAYANAWLMALQRSDVTAEELHDNMLHHVTISKYPPTVSELCYKKNKEVIPSKEETLLRLQSYEEKKPEQTEELIRAREEALKNLANLKNKVFKDVKDFTGGEEL